MTGRPQPATPTDVETLRHPADVTRPNIPTAETSSLMREAESSAPPLLYPRNTNLDPQLVWRGKDGDDAAPLSVPTVPIYIQEKVLPEALIRDLRRVSNGCEGQADLFGGFDRIADPEAKLEFYAHAENWSNRMILGDSLLVMNSLAEKEGLRGRVQMIYLDPPYGIRFSSNWQPSTRTRDVKEGKLDGLSREPEQIKAFRDTWRDGVHTYLSYWRDRLVVARELLSESGSVFVQIGDENVHLVRGLMDEVLGSQNAVSTIAFVKSSSSTGEFLGRQFDYLLWYARDHERTKFHPLYRTKEVGGSGASAYTKVRMPEGIIERLSNENATVGRVLRLDNITSQASGREKGEGAASWFPVRLSGKTFRPTETSRWKTNEMGMARLASADRLGASGNTLCYVRYLDDFRCFPIGPLWTDTTIAGFASAKRYVVETDLPIIERCLLMTTDPGDLVLDPTCGSGTTAFVAEQWGRRWITVDTSRVALALARTRLMAARHPAYLLRDSAEGVEKEAEITGHPAPDGPFRRDIRQGFVLERVPHVTLKSIANNAEIDVIHDKWLPLVDAARAAANAAFGKAWEEWEVPRPGPHADPHPDPIPEGDGQGKLPHPNPLPEGEGIALGKTRKVPTAPPLPTGEGRGEGSKQTALATFWNLRRQRQAEIDASIARNAETEFLHDRPYPKRNTVRVTGPFTVESLSPHRVLPTAEEEDVALLEALGEEAPATGKPVGSPSPRPSPAGRGGKQNGCAQASDDFVTAVLDNLAKAGVQNTRKKERLTFVTIRPWPGQGYVAAEATYEEAGQQRRAAIVIGPEYGTVGQELVREAARECRDWADALVICGFAFDPLVGETTMNLGRLVVLKARMSQELHAADAYKAGGGNLFVVFGEPDIALDQLEDGRCVIRLKGVEIFDPTTGEVRSSGRVEDDVACWFLDTNYDGDSFFVRHAYFLGGKDPYEKLKAALKAEVDEDSWASLYSAESRPFPLPRSGRIAVKVINHYGDEVVRVFRMA